MDSCAERSIKWRPTSSSEWAPPDPALQFAPTVFIDIAATVEKKLAAMECYASELRPHPHPRAIESLRARAAYWGQHAGLLFAEPFVLCREVVR